MADRERFPSGRHLVEAHDQLRRELTKVRELMAQIEAGTLGAGLARSRLVTMTMRQHTWTLGAYCQTYCRLLTMHHAREDTAMFPHLRRSDPALAPVLQRLEEEHKAIHEIIERVDRGLVALLTNSGAMKELRQAVELLTDDLHAHLSYEERELVEPLSRFGHGMPAAG